MGPEKLICRAVRERVLEVAEPAPVAHHEHLQSCGECARWCDRHERRVALLAGLERRAVPSDLEARVVAALGPEARRERALAALARLGRLKTPQELDGAVGESARQPAGRSRAPAVLERLVVEEIADPAKARVRRFVGSLPRRRAAAELDALVERELQKPRRRLSRPMRWGVVASLAASFLVAVVAPLLFSLRGMHEERYPFRVEYVRDDLGQLERASLLDPLAVQWLDGASGGMLSANRN